MNENNNNFSLIRNSEINRIGPQFIQPIFYDKLKINETMKTLGGYEDPKYIHEHSVLWKRENYIPQFANRLHLPGYLKQICIIGCENIPATINPKYDYIVLDTIPINQIQERLDSLGLSTFKCFSLPTHRELRNYFLIMYRSCSDYEIIDHYYFDYNTSIKDRHTVINKTTDPNASYLEIGVEYGYTFKNVHFTNKTGVDPDPKIESELIVKETSDEFFKTNQTNFDVVFIDGMHQSEFVLSDFNNTLNCLNENGTIFIDDILPINYNEQLKVPNNFIYENGILKYTSPWTGDVWKVVYYILKNFNSHFIFAYYNNINYRGVGMFKIKSLFQIEESAIETINNYNHLDFGDYLKCIKNCSRELNQTRMWLPWDEYIPNTVILLNENFVVIQIPKTSTTMLLNSIKGRDMDCYRHEGIRYIENFIRHDLPVYAVVRNPYTQIYSYFFHCVDRNGFKLDDNLTLKENFTVFVKLNINDTHVRQYDYIRSSKCTNVKIFKYEENNFVDYLNQKYNLSIDKSIKLNENKNPMYDKSKETIISFFSQELVELIQKHRVNEFEMFGYSKEIGEIE
jgi:hypothetical protein